MTSKLYNEASSFISTLEGKLERKEEAGQVFYYLPQELGLRAAVYLHEVYRDDGPKALISLWALLQKRSEVLFGAHLFMHKLPVMAANKWDLPKSYDCTKEGILANALKDFNPVRAQKTLENLGPGTTILS